MTLDLSKKRHYTFSQLATRLQCTEEDLRYLVLEGELTPSSFIGAGHYALHQMQPHEDYGTTGGVCPRVMLDTCSPDDVIERGWLSGFHYLVLPTRTSGNHCEFRFAAKFSSGFDLGDLIYELEAPVAIDEVMNSCFVMAVELDRFLAVQSRTKKTNEPDKALAARERTSFLNIIGALLAQLTAGKANDTTVITRAVTDYGAKQGISERKLQETFAAAKRSLGAS
jgi:hypothetical protein